MSDFCIIQAQKTQQRLTMETEATQYVNQLHTCLIGLVQNPPVNTSNPFKNIFLLSGSIFSKVIRLALASSNVGITWLAVTNTVIYLSLYLAQPMKPVPTVCLWNVKVLVWQIVYNFLRCMDTTHCSFNLSENCIHYCSLTAVICDCCLRCYHWLCVQQRDILNNYVEFLN